MKFNLLDAVIEITDQRLVAKKVVTLAEEYLADHFPTFPVLPGVLMLEAMTQAATWLMHTRNDFSGSMAVLKEARNVKYGQFIAPGDTLRVEVDFHRPTDSGATFKVNGLLDNDSALAARIEIAYFNLGDKNPQLAHLDEKIRRHNRQLWELLKPEKSARNVPV